MVSLGDHRRLASGELRDPYEVDRETLLPVASDRILAFDHVLETPIPDKGRVLTAMSVFWFELLGGDVAAPPVAHHLVASRDERTTEEVRGRALLAVYARGAGDAASRG